MRNAALWLVVGSVSLGIGGTAPGQFQVPLGQPALDWRMVLARRLPAFGHRNWIVIADSAYPSQTSPGIETVVTYGEQLDVVKQVLDEVEKMKHVRPVIHLDAELPLVTERDAPGISQYRHDLKHLLARRKLRALPHEEIIKNLDQAGAKFNVLILKTNLTLPYTSVFLELDCGYWSPEAEQRLRETLKAGEKTKQP